jgi:hypothetical protein
MGFCANLPIGLKRARRVAYMFTFTFTRLSGGCNDVFGLGPKAFQKGACEQEEEYS